MADKPSKKRVTDPKKIPFQRPSPRSEQFDQREHKNKVVRDQSGKPRHAKKPDKK